MNIIYQVRFKTCEDPGETFRADTFAYTDPVQAMVELKKKTQFLSDLVRRNNPDIRSVESNDGFNSEIKISDVSYAKVWVEQLLLS